jgi:hypothetical protein
MTDNFIGAARLSKYYQNRISLTDIPANYYTGGIGFCKNIFSVYQIKKPAII